MQKFGFLDKVKNLLKEANMEVKTIEGVEPDPSIGNSYERRRRDEKF